MSIVNQKVLVVCRKVSEAEPYIQAVEAAGAKPQLEQARLGLTIGDCSGLLLTGGTDVNPSRYDEPAAPLTDKPDKERDAVEAALIDEALDRDLPVLAICRGLQLLNVHLGGSLIQHLPNTDHHRKKTPEDKGRPAHRIAIKPGTLLAGIAQRDAWEVNSRHHQAVSRLGAGLRICATDPADGVIESIDLPGKRYVLAVQWHPENQAPNDPEQRKLFQSFADAL